MRKLVITLVALSLVAAASAFAGNLVNEGFSYSDGNLIPNNPGAPALGPWATYSGTTGDVQVVGGYATGIMNTATFANDDALPFTAATTSVPTYACFNVYIPAFGAGAPLPSYFAGLKDAGTSNLVARLYVVALGTTGSWTFAVSHYSTGSTVGVTPWGSALSSDTWYTVVVKYDPVAKSTTLWVNPVDETSTRVVDVNSTSTSFAVSTFFLRQGGLSTIPTGQVYNTGTTIWNWRVDNLGVGTTFAEACYAAPVSVNGSTWGKLKSLYR